MLRSFDIYLPGTTPIHRCDPRVKVLLLIAYSVAAFLVTRWLGLGLLALALVAMVLVAKLPLGRLLPLALPVVAILFVVLLCNSFVNVETGAALSALSGVSAGFAAGMAPIPLVGPIGFSPEGCVRGLFYALRILLIVWASFVVTFTTASHELTGSFSSFLSPLRALRAPVDDIAMVLSLALRFIPLVAAEFAGIRAAQVSRGAAYGTGSPWKRISGYSTVMVPLFVGMFRRADRMADAMDARCYGAGERTQLNPRSFTAASAAVLLAGTLLCIALALAF